MTTVRTHDILQAGLADPSHANAPKPRLSDDAPHAVRPLGEGIAAVETDGALVCVILSPVAWHRLQATTTAWQKLFHWALRHIDTPTLRQMYASADRVLDGRPVRSPACRQP